MKKIKRSKSIKSSPLGSKTRVWAVGIPVVLALLLLIALMVSENSEGNLTIKNNTDLKLEYVKYGFVAGEGPITDSIRQDNIEPNKSMVYPFNKVDLLGTESNLEIRFKYESYDEILVDAGYFDDAFTGKIAMDFTKTDNADVIKLHVKATNGFLKSKLIDCDETYTITLSEGFVAE